MNFPDITTPKVSIPATLFLLLSPGLLLNVRPEAGLNSLKPNFLSQKTSLSAVLTHALVFNIAVFSMLKMMGVSMKKTDLLVPTILFVMLSPGMLLTIPPGSGGLLTSGQTSLNSMLVHTIVFAIVYALLRANFPQFY